MPPPPPTPLDMLVVHLMEHIILHNFVRSVLSYLKTVMLQLVKIATARVVGCADGGKSSPLPVFGVRSSIGTLSRIRDKYCRVMCSRVRLDSLDKNRVEFG